MLVSDEDVSLSYAKSRQHRPQKQDQGKRLADTRVRGETKRGRQRKPQRGDRDAVGLITRGSVSHQIRQVIRSLSVACNLLQTLNHPSTSLLHF